MKIVTIYGNMSHYDYGLGEVLTRVKDIFGELEAECESVDLGALHPPYYDGESTRAIDDVVEKIKAADGVILACTAQMFAPTAIMLSFFEYLQDADYVDAFTEKRCMLVALSQAGGEKSALDYLSRVVNFLGGYVVAQAGLQARHLDEMDGDAGEILDKTAEDFYRAVKQGRKYIIPADFAPVAPEKIVVAEEAAPEPEPVFVPAQKLQTQLQNFSASQENEIEELTALFSQKFANNDGAKGGIDSVKEPLLTSGANALNVLNTSAARKVTTPAPSNPFAPTADEAAQIAENSAEALTRELPEKFQAQLSAGLQATIQISVTGGEKFDGILHIHSTECVYRQGSAPAPDITIMADSAVWHDVLSGKTTAQKAFMIGGIKVRGDFVLLTKFDTLFNAGA